MRVDVVQRVSGLWNKYRQFQENVKPIMENAPGKEEKWGVFSTVCNVKNPSQKDWGQVAQESQDIDCALLHWELKQGRI